MKDQHPSWQVLHNFIFRQPKSAKDTLNLAFKYLVLFRGAILTLPPPPWDFAAAIFQRRRARAEAPKHPNTIKNHALGSAPERITEIDQLQAEIHPAHTSLPHLDHCLQMEAPSAKAHPKMPQKHNLTQRQLRHRHLEQIHRPLLEQLGQPLPERMPR
jgi:hypothetical protein